MKEQKKFLPTVSLMNKLLVCLSLCLLVSTALPAQKRKNREFEMTMPEQKVANSPYNKIILLDQRDDTSKMGIVQIQSLNTKARVVAKVPLSVQLNNFINALTDSSAKDGALILQLTQFSLAEVSGTINEKGYCHMRANLYASSGDRYQKIKSVDTIIVVKALDVTKTLLKTGNKIIPEFIAENLFLKGGDSIYFSYNEIVHMDSIEKRKLKLYNALSYADGLYKNYQSFRDQVPDKQILNVEIKKGKISSVTTLDEFRQSMTVKPKDIYAIVYNNQPYIATEFGYYLLEKIDDNFFFTGKARMAANPGDVMMASMLFGVLGSLLVSDSEATLRMKIDYVSGGLIRLKEVKKGEN